MPYRDPGAQQAYKNEWRRKHRAEFFADKACEWCDSQDRLELHHRDTRQKESHRVWGWGAAARAAELAKCIVLCHDCHHLWHTAARGRAAQLRNPCGTPGSYRRGCRCEPCRTANREYNRRRAKGAA